MNRASLLLAVALLAVLAAVVPTAILLEQPYLLVLFGRMAILATAAVGLNLLLGNGGLPAFGHAAFVGIGSYTVGVTAAEGWLTTGWLQFPLAASLAAGAALAIGSISLRTRGVAFLMITLAFGQMLFYAAVALERYGGDDGMTLAQPTQFGTLQLTRGFGSYAIAVLALIVSTYVTWRLARSPFGATLRGAAANERRMKAIGVNVFRYRLAAFGISGAICGLAGALLANHTAFVSPATLAWSRSVELAVVVLLGGAGTVFGPLFGAAAFVLLEEVLSGATEHWRIVFGPLLLLVVLAAPGGIASLLEPRRHD
ncbi:MAG: branched-chain amino acid ABC transporter permease [Alphaproteobacteria bacterium]|nr:branched-chain amino acid ABC transporter permease [Alphaproteobacteria bacterium]